MANFLWLPLGRDSVAFAEHCRAAGVAARARPGSGVRITFGTPEAHRRLLEAVARFKRGTTTPDTS